MEEIEDEINECNKSGDLSLHVHGVDGGKDISEGKDLDFFIETFHTPSNEDAGLVGDPVNRHTKEFVGEVKEEYNENVIDENCNVDITMATLHAENYVSSKLRQENESHITDVEGIDGPANKSQDSLLYHSTDSAQFHSADDEQLDEELKQNGHGNDIFNLGVQITINDQFEDFVKDVTTSSEILDTDYKYENNEHFSDVISNGTVSDPAVTITTICETDKVRQISELASEEADAVVMKTFMISSDEYDATVTTMLEISPTPMDAVDTPLNENSIVKTFEISSSKYNATITTTVEDVTDTDTDISHGKSLEILRQISDDIDEGNDSHDEEVKFQIARCNQNQPQNNLVKDMGVISVETDDDYLKKSLETDNSTIITISPGSSSSIKKSYEELSRSLDSIDPVAADPVIDKMSDEHDVTIQNANEVSCETGMSDGLKLPCATDPDTTFEDIDIAVSDISASDIEVAAVHSHDTALKGPDMLSVNDESVILTSSPGTVCELRKSYEDLASAADTCDSSKSDKKDSIDLELVGEIPVVKADLLIHNVEPDIDSQPSEKSPREIVDMSSYESYDNILEKEGTSPHITTDISAPSSEVLSESPTVISQVPSADSDQAIEETSSFETDVNMQNIYSLLPETDNEVCNIDSYKPYENGNIIEVISSSDGNATADILCDVSPDQSCESLETGLDEPKLNEMQKTKIEMSTQLSVASGSNRSYDVLSIDSDMEITHKIVSDYGKEFDDTNIEINDVVAKNSDIIDEKDVDKDGTDIIITEADEDMNNIDMINDFSENEADVIIEKTFEDLSNEIVRRKSSAHTSETTDTCEKALDVSLESKTYDQVKANLSDKLDTTAESMRKISSFSEHEADTIIHQTYEDLSSDSINAIVMETPSIIESDVPEKAYDVSDEDEKVVDEVELPSNVDVEENFAQPSIEEDIQVDSINPVTVSDENIVLTSEVSVESEPTEIDLTNAESDSIVDIPLDVVSIDTTPDIIKNSISSKESLPSTEITYHILSFGNGPSNEADISTVVNIVDKQVSRTDDSDTFEHLKEDYDSKNDLFSEEHNDCTRDHDSSFDIANISIDKTEEVISDEVNLSVSEITILPNENAYDVYSFEDSTPSKAEGTYGLYPIDDTKVDEAFEHLKCEDKEVSSDIPKTEVIDSHTAIDVSALSTTHTESDNTSSDKTYQIVSFESRNSLEDNDTSIDKQSDVIGEKSKSDESKSDESKADKQETFEHLSSNDYAIKKNANDEKSVSSDSSSDSSSESSHVSSDNIKDSTSDYVDIDHKDDDEMIDENISLYLKDTAGPDSLDDACIDTDMDKPPVPTLSEVAGIYEITKDETTLSNDDLTLYVISENKDKCQRENSAFEVIEGSDSDVESNKSIDSNAKGNEIPPVDLDVNESTEKDNMIVAEETNTLKVEPVLTVSAEHTSNNSVETSGEKTVDINECQEEKEKSITGDESLPSPKKSPGIDKIKVKKPKDKKMPTASLEEYDVIEHAEINTAVIPDYEANPRFSFAVLSFKIKQAFTPAEPKTKPDVFTTPVSNTKPRVSVHMEETSSGEKIQVLTFSRNAVRYDSNRSPDSPYQNGDTTLDDDAFIDGSPDRSDSKIDRRPVMGDGGVKQRIAMMENDLPAETFNRAIANKGKSSPHKNSRGVIGEHIVKPPVVVAKPADLKLASLKLTLTKDALMTDRYPPVIPDYPSDRRSLIALEIYTTERSFVRGLEIAAKIFKPKIESSGLLDANEMYSVFSTIEEILQLNTDLLQKIFERIASWSDEQCIGDVFLPFKGDFSIYAKYSVNYDKGQEIILQKQKKKDFEAVLKECYANPKCMVGQTLASYLITVIQRLPRYILLLKDLSKRTPDDHPDSTNLKDALAMMEEKAAYINEQLKKAQCMQALAALETQITGLKQYYIPERTFVYEGPVCLLTAQKTYQGVLFNDIFVFAYKGEKLQSEVELVLELNTVWVEDLGDLDPQTTKCDAIGVYTPDRPYRMYVSSVGEKKIWLQHLRATLFSIAGNDKESDARNARHNYKNGTIYDGSFQNTKRHGFGKLTIPSVMTYEGEWADDEKNGRGIAKYYTGEVFDGYWVDDKQDGPGTFRYATGDEISCEWTEGVKNGPCVITYKNGDKFTGQCVDGQIQGEGTLICVNGYKYVGQWAKNMKHGKGTLEAPDGMHYTGDFARDRFHGNGELLYSDGSYYKGEFEHGLRFGEGIFNDKSGCCSYEGKWVDDKKNGRGKMIYNYGDVYDGTWVMDKRQGKGKMTYAHGGSYDGGWDNDLKHGKGKFELKDGSLYDGEFDADQMSGYGTMKYSDGSRYHGDWKNDIPDGKGIWTKPNGWVCDGTWVNGRQNGACSLKDPANEYQYQGDWLNGIKEGIGTEIIQGFTYSGSFLEDMYHGPGLETGPEGSKYDGLWYRGLKHGKGVLTHVNKLTENQTWKHGCLVESPMIDIPRERTPIQRWHHT